MARGRFICTISNGVRSGWSDLWTGSSTPDNLNRRIFLFYKVHLRLAVLLCLFIFVANASQAEQVRLTSGEWPPFQSKSLAHGGVATRIVTEAFKMEGLTVEYGYFPWKRSLKLAETGKWDGTFLWFDTPKRRQLFFISEPIIKAKYVFFHLKDLNFDWDSLADLSGFLIGGTLGYDYGKAFQSAEANGNLTIKRKPSDLENFSQLVKGHIQLFPCEKSVGYTLIQSAFPAGVAAGITHHNKPLKVAPHHLLLSRKVRGNQKRLEKFNRALKNLRSSGKLGQYLREMPDAGNPMNPSQ